MTTTITDVTILSELDRKFAEAAAIVPQDMVTKMEALIDTLTIDSDADMQIAADLGSTVATWTSKIDNFWEPWREHYFRRYKAIMGIAQNGVATADVEGNPLHSVTGTVKLGEIRKKIEHLMRDYRIRRDRDKAKRQETLNEMVAITRTAVETQVQDMMHEGDFDSARRLRFEAANLHPVAIMQSNAPLTGAGVRQPYKWSLDEDGLMKVIKAIAAGDVELFHDISVKGKLERRSLIELSSVVLNYKTRELGDSLGIPGITVTPDITFSFSKSTAK